MQPHIRRMKQDHVRKVALPPLFLTPLYHDPAPRARAHQPTHLPNATHSYHCTHLQCIAKHFFLAIHQTDMVQSVN